MLQEQINLVNAAYHNLMESEAAANIPGAGILVHSARTSPALTAIAPPASRPPARDGGAAFLSIEDAIQANSDRSVSPRAESLSPVLPGLGGSSEGRGTSDKDDTHTLPKILASPPGEVRRATPQEAELYRAAEQICVLLSGVDYRTLALQSTRACDLVSRMICEEVSLAKRSDWVPSYLVARQTDRLRQLFRETKQLLESNGVEIPVALERITSPAPPTSPGAASRQRTVSVDASATGGGRGHRIDTDGVLRPMIPAADEAYDVRLMHSAFDDRSDSKSRDLEDEVMVLKSRLDKANREKRELQGTVERQEQQLVAMRTKLTKDTEVFYQTQRQMQADLRQLAVTTGHRELLNSDDEANMSPTEQRPSPTALNNYAPRPLVPTPPDAALMPPTAPDEDRPASTTARPHRPSNHTSSENQQQPFGKYNRLDTLYHDVYNGKGMEFLRQAIDVVFKVEYDTSQPPAPGASSTVSTDGVGSPNGVAMHASREELLQDVHAKFVKDIQHQVMTTVENFSSFRSLIAEVTPLRSEYVAQCVQMRTKPNSGVVALLSKVSVDSDVIELNLSGNYVGDSGLTPLLPVLGRLYRLRTLRLADNGLKNNAVRALCLAIRTHPSLTAIDLSKNSITRAAGRELMGLVASMPKLRVIDVSKTMIDEPLVQKLKDRLELNQTGQRRTDYHAEIVEGGAGRGPSTTGSDPNMSAPRHIGDSPRSVS
jgi:hypothetical protein